MSDYVVRGAGDVVLERLHSDRVRGISAYDVRGYSSRLYRDSGVIGLKASHLIGLKASHLKFNDEVQKFNMPKMQCKVRLYYCQREVLK